MKWLTLLVKLTVRAHHLVVMTRPLRPNPRHRAADRLARRAHAASATTPAPATTPDPATTPTPVPTIAQIPTSDLSQAAESSPTVNAVEPADKWSVMVSPVRFFFSRLHPPRFFMVNRKHLPNTFERCNTLPDQPETNPPTSDPSRRGGIMG